jgi:hypothetical protein
LRCLSPLAILLRGDAVGLQRQGRPAPAAAAPPQVTVAQPTKRVVTDWDEFTGASRRWKKSRSAPGSADLSTPSSSRTAISSSPAICSTSSIHGPSRRLRMQADGQLADARAKAELARRELERALTLNQTQAVSEFHRRPAPPDLAGRACRRDAGRRRVEGGKAQCRIHPCDRADCRRISRHLVSPGNLVQGSDTGTSTLLTSIVALDPIYVYFDMDEATFIKYSKLWFEGKRPSSRDTANPVQVTLAGETKPSHEGTINFLDNRLDVSTGPCAAAP